MFQALLSEHKMVLISGKEGRVRAAEVVDIAHTDTINNEYAYFHIKGALT